MTVHPSLENTTFDELQLGEAVSVSRILSPRDAELLAALTGASCAPQAWAGFLLALLAESRFPGPGSELVACDLHFSGVPKTGSRIETRLTVREKYEPGRVVMDCLVRDGDGMELAAGSLILRAPAKKIRLDFDEPVLPEIHAHVRHTQLVARCAALAPAVTAVVHPCDAASLAATVEAAAAGLILPILVGPAEKIRAAAAGANLDIAKFRLVPTPHSHAAADEAVAMARRGEVEALMKGSLHTDELMHAVLAPGSGLGTGRRVSHCYLFDVAAYPRPLFVTDAAVNIAPGLAEKRDILQNAIELAHVMGVEKPKAAILSAVETVSEKMPSTLDAAALCKMAERGQITGALVDGPLAFDNAVSAEAARIKNIVSPVAGQADILLVPNLEAGNMLAKQLTFFEGADGAGIVLGARLPIILTSLADPEKTRIASCAMALLLVAARRGTS